MTTQQSGLPAARTSLHLEVNFRRNYGRHDTSGVLKNISLTGAFLEKANHELNISEKISLTFVVAARSRKISAEVIWKNSYGVGVRFIPINNQDVQIIDDLIYFVESKRMGDKGIFEGILKKVS